MPDQQSQIIIEDAIMICPVVKDFVDAIVGIDPAFEVMNYTFTFGAWVEVELTLQYRTSQCHIEETREYESGHLRSRSFRHTPLIDWNELRLPNFYLKKPSRPKACVGCTNYHGQTYAGNRLICGVHPYGWEGDNCPDWEEE